MKRIITLFCLLSLATFPGLWGKLHAQCGQTGCNGNTYLNASDPNTIVYDNMVGGYNSNLVRKADGTLWGWGEAMGPGGNTALVTYTPYQISPANGYNYTGNILLFTNGGSGSYPGNVGSMQTLLTTDGIYAWGTARSVYTQTVAPPAPTFPADYVPFKKITPLNGVNGLPPGVVPTDVKMLFSTSYTLLLTTCSGAVWILNSSGVTASYGNNTTTVTTPMLSTWIQVQQGTASGVTGPLTDVVAARGAGNRGFIALKKDGTVWTWGQYTLLGDGTATVARPYAQQMTLPVGVTPKMIGATAGSIVTYYILGTNGHVYGIGSSANFALGNNVGGGMSNVWVEPKVNGTGAALTNITYISPAEHNSLIAGINALTADGKLWAWGTNNAEMLNTGFSGPINPTSPTGGLSNTDVVTAIETGGSHTIITKQCESSYGFIGSKQYGTRGDGGNVTQFTTSIGTYFPTPSATNPATPQIAPCGNGGGTLQITPPANGFVCNGTTLTSSYTGGQWSIASGNATIDASTGVVTLTGAGQITVNYGPAGCETPATVTLQQADFGNLDANKWPIASATNTAVNSAWLGNDFPTTDCQTTTTDPADGLTITGSTGAGTQASPWTLHLGRTYSFNLTVNGNGTAKPVYWAIWYDVNGDGDFTDTDDYFNTGNITHGSPVAVPPFNVTVPVTAGTTGAIRVVATGSTTTFTKAMNGQVAVENGEVEDFFVVQNEAPQTINGTVFNDNNGMTGGVNGTPMAGVTVTLYAADGTTVIAITTTDANGNYNFAGLNGGDYIIGVTPPTGYNNISSTDATPADGRTSVNLPVGGAGTNGINFGLNRPPVADTKTQTINQPTGNTIPAGTVTQDVSGLDPEDGTLGATNTIVITQLPANATMLYSGIPVTPGQQITNFDPALVSYTNINNGSTSVVFNYAFIDEAGVQGPSASFSVNWLIPLPVKLQSFAAHVLNKNQVQIEWISALEQNFSHYELQYAADGIQFITVGTLKGGRINGRYEFQYTQPDITGYYRLKMVDIDGGTSWSAVVKVQVSGTAAILVYPVPVLKNATIKGTRQGDELLLYNAQGQLLQRVKANGSITNIDMSHYTTGLYLLELLRNGQVTQQEKLLKK